MKYNYFIPFNLDIDEMVLQEYPKFKPYNKEKLLDNGDRWENVLAANIKADNSHR